jgi:hypothetical protein
MQLFGFRHRGKALCNGKEMKRRWVQTDPILCSRLLRHVPCFHALRLHALQLRRALLQLDLLCLGTLCTLLTCSRVVCERASRSADPKAAPHLDARRVPHEA